MPPPRLVTAQADLPSRRPTPDWHPRRRRRRRPYRSRSCRRSLLAVETFAWLLPAAFVGLALAGGNSCRLLRDGCTFAHNVAAFTCRNGGGHGRALVATNGRHPREAMGLVFSGRRSRQMGNTARRPQGCGAAGESTGSETACGVAVSTRRLTTSSSRQRRCSVYNRDDERGLDMHPKLMTIAAAPPRFCRHQRWRKRPIPGDGRSRRCICGRRTRAARPPSGTRPRQCFCHSAMPSTTSRRHSAFTSKVVKADLDFSAISTA